MEPVNVAPSAEYSRRLQAREAKSRGSISSRHVFPTYAWLWQFWRSLQSGSVTTGGSSPSALFLVAVIYHSRVRRTRASADRRGSSLSSRHRTHRRSLERPAAIPARASTIRIMCTQRISICSGRAICSSCCRSRARGWARTRSRAGCWRRLRSQRFWSDSRAVAELRDRVDLREDLAVLGEIRRSGRAAAGAGALGGDSQSTSCRVGIAGRAAAAAAAHRRRS